MLKHINRIIAVTFLTVISTFGFAQKGSKKGKNEKDKDKLKLKIELIKAEARSKYLDGNKYLALTKYKEALSLAPEDPRVHYRIAEIYYYQQLFKRSLTEIKKAENLGEKDKQLYYWFGMIHLALEQPDSSILYFEKVKTLGYENVVKKNYVDMFISKAQNAKELMANPVDVTKTRMDRQINSRNHDYGAVYNTNENKFYFSTRRQSNTGGLQASCIDNDFYSDIWVSTWDSTANSWKSAEIVEGKVNSDYFDDILTFHNGEMYVFRKDGCEENYNVGDIMISKQNKKGRWSTPKSIEAINTDYFETCASLTEDGLTMYFISDRKGSLGGTDIWMSTRTEKSDWTEPINVGNIVNTVFSETTVFISPDGNTLYFSSTGHDGMGGFDIFMSKKVDGEWLAPVNMGYPINTVWDDVHFSISKDKKNGYLDVVDPNNGMGKLDIYKLDLSNYKWPD